MIELWYLVGSSGQSPEKEIVGPKLGPIRAKKGAKWGFRPFSCSKYALVFANFAYYDRELWYLVGSDGQCAKLFLLALKLAQLGPKKGQNEVTGDRPSKRLPDFEGPLLFIIMSKLCPGTFSNKSFTQSPPS